MSRYDRDRRTIREIIHDEKKARIWRKPDFPSELLDRTFAELDTLARQGKRRARQLRKVLTGDSISERVFLLDETANW